MVCDMDADNFIERLSTLTGGDGSACETCGKHVGRCEYDCTRCYMVACEGCVRLRFPPEARDSQKTGWMCPECCEVTMWCK